MEYIWIVGAIASLISLLFGLSLLLGLGWTMFIIDLLTQNVTSDYANDQLRNPPAQNAQMKQRGMVFVILGIVTGLLTIASL